jgi:hypothetical protein
MNKSTNPRRVGFEAILFIADRGFRFLPWNEKEERPAYKWSGENQKNFTSDINKLLEWQEQGFRRFLYLPSHSGFIGFDIDRGHADGRDGLVGFYEVMWNLAGKKPERLPYYLRDLPNNFPCYTKTPSGGFHLLFKYCGLCKIANLIHKNHKIEVKYLNSCLSLGEKENGAYVLYGDPLDAPELPPFLMELINPQLKQNFESKLAVNQKRRKPNLEKILDRVLAASTGNNDTQKKFAWRAAYFDYALDDVLAFVKSRPDAFGNGSDTGVVINHAWRSNAERAAL